MKTSDQGLDLIKRMETWKPQMYRDFIGLPTIGVGHLLTKDELYSGKIAIDGQQVDWHTGLTDDQIKWLLEQDLTITEHAINVDGLTLNQNQFDALASLVFNIGTGAYGRSTLRKKLLLGQFDQVPDQMKRWIYAGGVVSPVLEARREDEVQRWNMPIVRAATPA